VDLFVRERNTLAIAMYQKLGYSVYRRVLGYYGDNGEDAYGEPSIARARRRRIAAEAN